MIVPSIVMITPFIKNLMHESLQLDIIFRFLEINNSLSFFVPIGVCVERKTLNCTDPNSGITYPQGTRIVTDCDIWSVHVQYSLQKYYGVSSNNRL